MPTERGKRVPQSNERGLSMITVLGAILIVTVIGVASIGLMDTDMLHASIQNAVARSFYIAQAGLEEAEGLVAAAADPVAFTTRDTGVTIAYGDGQVTYWVDAGPATGCGDGFKTLEALGEVRVLGRTIPARVRACGVPGTPISTALFGVSRVEVQGPAARMYLAPYGDGTPGGGGSLGSFTEIHIADAGARINALSEEFTDLVTLRDVGAVPDYALFGFSQHPDYDPNPAAAPAPWVLGLFGDFVKAQPKEGMLQNSCGTPYACVTGPFDRSDILSIPALRSTVESGTHDAYGLQHVYMNHMRQERMPLLSLDPAAFKNLAASNAANAALNEHAGFGKKTDSIYGPVQFYDLVTYLAAHPAESLQGTVYVSGTLNFWQNVSLGGNAGNVTLVVEGDLVLGTDVPIGGLAAEAGTNIVNRHNLSTVSGRITPGILVFGLSTPDDRPIRVCGGETVNGSGRLVLCGKNRQRLIADGLIYSADGMVIQPGAYVDQIGAMYHGSRGLATPSFVNHNATVVLRFDPLALSAFGTGISILSWQQVHGPGPAGQALASSPATVSGPAAPIEARALAARVPPAIAGPPPAPSGPVPAPPAAAPPDPALRPQRANPDIGLGPAPVPPSTRKAQAAHPASSPPNLVGRPKFHIQAGAFRNREYADDLVRQLRAHGHTVTLSKGPLIRVWVGQPMSEQAAERIAANLRSDGFEATLSTVR